MSKGSITTKVKSTFEDGNKRTKLNPYNRRQRTPNEWEEILEEELEDNSFNDNDENEIEDRP